MLGVDVGGTGIKIGAVEVGDSPVVVASDVIGDHAQKDPREVLPLVADRLQDLVRTAGWDTVDGVGVGSAGLIRNDGVVAFSPNLPAWTGAEIKTTLTGLLELPVTVDNDVNAFALAEWRWGAGEHAAHAAFLTLGTGIGGAFISNGELLRGAAGFAGEPGHATLVLGGIPCPCGNLGCAERYVGNKDIVAAAKAHPGFSKDPALKAVNPLTPEVLTQAAADGSRVAREVFIQVGGALGGLLVGMVNMLNPERVVIGGGVALAGKWILDPAREHLEKHSLVARYSPPRVLPAALGDSAGLLGAAALALESDLG